MMKKKLLFIALLTVGMNSFAQFQFKKSNAPSAGDSISLYVIDSAVVSYEGISGTNVTWDYSTINGYNSQTKTVKAIDPSDTPFDVTFQNSDLAIEVEGLLTTYFTDTLDERISQGVIYKDADFGDLILTLENDPGKYYEYPFMEGDSIVDSIMGTATFQMGQTPINAPAVGELTATLDGVGTLELPSTTFLNVVRYVLVDTINLDTPLGQYQLTSKQYEYYDLSFSSLPIFVHSSLKLGRANQPFNRDYTLVLSIIDPVTVGVEENILGATKIYPNPTSNEVSIRLPESIHEASMKVIDAVGRTVSESTVDRVLKTIDVSTLKEGVYFVKLTSDKRTATKTLIIQK